MIVYNSRMGNCFCFTCIHENSQLFDEEGQVANDEVTATSTNQPSRNAMSRRSDRRHSHNESESHYNLGYDQGPVFYIRPGVPCPLSQLNDEDQIRIAKRMGLLHHLPLEYYTDEMKLKTTECIICMCDYIVGEETRCLPCLHTFHRACIDAWLMRSFACPSCLEPVEPGMLATIPPLPPASSSTSPPPPPPPPT